VPYSDSVKTCESGEPCGYHAGDIKLLKRHALVDTGGRAFLLSVHRASVQDPDGARQLPRASRGFKTIKSFGTGH
jgi:putative transposase